MDPDSSDLSEVGSVYDVQPSTAFDTSHADPEELEILDELDQPNATTPTVERVDSRPLEEVELALIHEAINPLLVIRYPV